MICYLAFLVLFTYLRSYGAASVSASGIVLGKLAAGNGGRQIKVWRRACSAGL